MGNFKVKRQKRVFSTARPHRSFNQQSHVREEIHLCATKHGIKLNKQKMFAIKVSEIISRELFELSVFGVSRKISWDDSNSCGRIEEVFT